MVFNGFNGFNGNDSGKDKQIKALQKDLTNEKIQKEKLAKELEALKKACTCLQEENKELKENTNAISSNKLEESLDKLNEEKCRLQELLKAKEDELAQVYAQKESGENLFNDRIKQMQENISAKEVQLCVKEKELDKRENSLKISEAEQAQKLEVLSAEKAQVHKDKRELDIEIRSLEKRIEDADKKETELDQKIVDLRKKESDLIDKEDAINKQYANLESELENIRKKAESDLENDRNIALREIATLKAEAGKEREKLQTEAVQNSATLKLAAQEAMQKWQEQETNAVIIACNNLKEKLNEEISASRDLLFKQVDADIQKERETRLTSLAEEVNTKRAELKKEQEEIENLKIVVSKEYEDLKKKSIECDAKLDEVKWEKEKYQRKNAELEKRERNINEEIQKTYKKTIDDYEYELSELSRQLDEAGKAYHLVLEDLDAYESIKKNFPKDTPKMLKQRLEDLAKDKKSLEDQLAKRPSEGTKEELANCKKAFAALSEDYQGVLAKCQELELVHKKYVSLEIERDMLIDEINGLKFDLDTKKNRIAELEQEVRRLNSTEAIAEEYDKRLKDIKREFFEGVENPQDFDGQPTDEIEWLNEISRNCYEYGIAFPKRILYAFHTALKISDWSTITVLAGVSGTGKSELPRLYCEMGRVLFTPVSVQPNWDSQESMLGFYNSIDNRFEAQPVLRSLVQCVEELDQCMSIVLLDEMNLAHVEYYFADFLSKLELRRGAAIEELPKIEVKLGAGVPSYHLPLTRNILWCGTMNQDETTKSLSDKVLDRGLVINFPRPKKLKGRNSMISLPMFKENKGLDTKPFLCYSRWRSWLVVDIEADKDGIKGFRGEQLEELNRLKCVVEQINNCLGVVGRALGHRVWQSIEFYIANYPDVIAAKEKTQNGEMTTELKLAMHIALEDQIVQKVMPKLRGIDTRGFAQTKCLIPIKNILMNEGFNLENDFDHAMELGYGQFMWASAEYVDDKDIAGVTKDSQ